MKLYADLSRQDQPIERHRIVDLHLATALQQLAGDLDSRRFPQIVGIGLESQPQQSDGAAFENLQFTQFDDGHPDVVFTRRGHQGRSIFTKA
jgi:hypothetical protein